MSSSKILKQPELSAYERWELPNVSGLDFKEGVDLKTTIRNATGHITVEDIEKIQKKAYAEGFDKGYQDGVEKGLAETRPVIEKQLAQLNTMLDMLAEPLKELDESVIQQTAELAVAVARQLVRRELRTDPNQVVAVVREAINILPVGARNVQVYLHPEDAALIRDAFSVDENEPDSSLNWKIVEEPLLSRGGCKVRAENSHIDATVEKRINRITAAILGGERATDPGNHE